MKEPDEAVASALAAVRARIAAACRACGRQGAEITIVAVTKGFGHRAIEAAIDAGLKDIGENYYQEAAEKFKQVTWPAGVTRHFIGRVQRNKARRIAELFDVVQTVADLDVAAALQSAASFGGKILGVLAQVNVALDQRQGVAPQRLGDFISALLEHRNLRVHGLMAMGPRDRAAAPAAFERAARCYATVRALVPTASVLSMGMSDDMEVALAHESTMLRLGTALFGLRVV
jgi:PLP dependent protein